MERLGLVGLAGSGKSTLFSALTGVEPEPFASTVGIAFVEDERLDRLAAMSESKKVVRATMELVDIPGLAAGGEGAGARFLHAIREADAICFVLAAFGADDDPLASLETLELELVIGDADSAASQLLKRRKMLKGDKSVAGEVAALEKATALLDEGTPLYRAGLSDDDLSALKPFFLMTTKSVLVVVNAGEGGAAAATTAVASAIGDAAEVVEVNAAFELDLRDLDAADQADFLADAGLTEAALPRFVRAAYHLLGRRTFLTTGDKESRAWTFRAGAKAPECAGVIHSDLQRGFIRAEVVRWDELLELGSWANARDVGKLRTEGKEYEVLDGDVVEIRFNV